jgi:hypothetical protein
MTRRELMIYAASSVGIAKSPRGTIADEVYGGAYWDTQRRMDEHTIIWVAESHPGFLTPKSKGVCMHHMQQGGCGWEWNPWDYDDDAMRLVIALGMTVDVNREVGLVTVLYRLSDEPALLSLVEHSEGDLEACSRHAIVRAAAEIGKPLFGKKVVINRDVPYCEPVPVVDKTLSSGSMQPVTEGELEREQNNLAGEISRLSGMLDARAPHFIDGHE